MNRQQQRYITKVRIENFQSHEDTEFELSPGVNLIVGSSEAGKSAILRAINFAMHNEPRGDDFVRIERDETRVHLWWSDGCYLCRIKGTNRNAVIVRDKDGYETGFDRIGTSLPQEALDILGNPPIDSESGPIAYSDQHQPLFLVTLTASELPKTISRLTGIDDFEDAAELLNKEANAANKKIKDSTKRIEHIDVQLKNFIQLDDQLDQLDQMELLATQIDDIATDVQKAQSLKDSYDDIKKLGRAANAALKEAQQIAVLAQDLQPIDTLLGNLTRAKKLLDKHNNIILMEQEAKEALAVSSNIASDDNQQQLTVVFTCIQNINRAQDLLDKYLQLRQKGKALKVEYDKWNLELERLQKHNATLVEKMKESQLWCNVCQRPVSMDECQS
jgi:exonuclease SbcC